MTVEDHTITLALDVGNSRLKWGVYQGNAWQSFGAVPTSELATLWATHWKDLPKPTKIIGANVAGEAARAWLLSVVATWGEKIEWLVPVAEGFGVKNNYQKPATLGADRFAALIALRARQKEMAKNGVCPPLLRVSLGTTVVVDTLSSEGVFLGGIIFPGFSMARQSLSVNTAALSLNLPIGEYADFPQKTEDAIFTGALDAVVGTVLCRRKKVATHLKVSEDEVTIFVDGGDAETVMPLFPAPKILARNLVLEGLWRVANFGK